ncbi:hypothetical protein [Klebsiella pneumoniae]|uniref:hypothetical protein n=1 Tax=Klebsiella pneumoniae TaxID=573 RepID=UPI0011552767|nr:hypothetical protein [Klebsiella pneumoniae]
MSYVLANHLVVSSAQFVGAAPAGGASVMGRELAVIFLVAEDGVVRVRVQVRVLGAGHLLAG